MNLARRQADEVRALASEHTEAGTVERGVYDAFEIALRTFADEIEHVLEGAA